MSDHPKEAERNLKRIRICDDIYFDVFHWLAPEKIGLELALVSDRFDAMVDTHFKNRKWTLGKLAIYLENIFKRNDDGTTQKTLPFPQKPLPASIVGFSYVYICSYLSADAMAFLQRIGRLLESDVCLKLHIYGQQDWDFFATSVWPLLDVSAIIKLHLGYPIGFPHFRHIILPSILCDFTNLRFLFFDYGILLQFPPDDSNGSSDGQALCKWLHTPRADGQPKVIKCWWEGDKITMDTLKTTFLNATTSVSFIIHLHSSYISPFELVNWMTREQLTCRRIDNDGGKWWMIERSPIDKCAKQWAKWERETLKNGKNDWNVLRLCFLDDNVW